MDENTRGWLSNVIVCVTMILLLFRFVSCAEHQIDINANPTAATQNIK